jgi:hypothetical protein
MTSTTPQPRWFHPTPAWLIFGLLVVEGLLWLSERYRWFWFNERKGWTSLIAVAAVAAALVLMLLWFIASLVFRRRFQFGIRALLVLTLAVAVPCSWIAVGMKHAREQREIVAELRKAGGFVRYDWEYDTDLDWIPNAQPAEPAWLRILLGDDYFAIVVFVFTDAELIRFEVFRDLKGLSLAGASVTDTKLERLEEFRNLVFLHVSKTSVTDEGLAHLARLPNLRRLFLASTRITDTGLAYLKGSTKLEELYLGDTQLTDKGLKHLRPLIHLRVLQLDGTQVTDSGLEQLTGLSELKYLGVRFTKVTDAGKKKLRPALPKCWINRDAY